jgi:hypothetical protein
MQSPLPAAADPEQLSPVLALTLNGPPGLSGPPTDTCTSTFCPTVGELGEMRVMEVLVAAGSTTSMTDPLALV